MALSGYDRELEDGEFLFEVRYSRDGELGEWRAVDQPLRLDRESWSEEDGYGVGFVIDPHVGVAPFVLGTGDGVRAGATLPELVRAAVGAGDVEWTRWPAPLGPQGLKEGRGRTYSLIEMVVPLVPLAYDWRTAEVNGGGLLEQPVVGELRVRHQP